MPIYRDEHMIWRVGISGTRGIHSMNGKTLAEAVAEGWGNRLADVGCTNDQYAAIEAEMELQRTWGQWCDTCDRRTIWGHDGCHRCPTQPYHSAGCPKCGMITYHTDKGCVECARQSWLEWRRGSGYRQFQTSKL